MRSRISLPHCICNLHPLSGSFLHHQEFRYLYQHLHHPVHYEVLSVSGKPVRLHAGKLFRRILLRLLQLHHYCIISECRNLLSFAHALNIDIPIPSLLETTTSILISKGSCPCSDCVTCCSSIPCSSCGVLHLLRSKLTDCIFLSVNFDRCILYNLG